MTARGGSTLELRPPTLIDATYEHHDEDSGDLPGERWAPTAN